MTGSQPRKTAAFGDTREEENERKQFRNLIDDLLLNDGEFKEK